MPKYTKDEKAQALQRLHEWIKPGDTVYTILRHVSSSGMSHEIGIVLLSCKGDQPVDLHPNWATACALGERMGKRDGVIVGGCGMDMGFHLVYSLSHVLFPRGYGCIGKGCPSNDHTNGDRSYVLHAAGEPRYAKDAKFNDGPMSWSKSGRIHWHKDGGYAIRHRWL